MTIHLVFLYANADSSCSLCGRRGHLVAACCYEVRTDSQVPVYTGIEVCPPCLAREGVGAAAKVMRRVRRELIAGLGRPTTPLERENARDLRACCDELVELVAHGRCLMPPVLPARWIAREK